MSDSKLDWHSPSRMTPDRKETLAKNLKQAFRLEQGGSFTELLAQIDQAHARR